MKREIKQPPYVNKTFPLLIWKKCEFCNKEFVREWGWKIEDMPAIISNVTSCYIQTKYICNECASTKDELIQKINNRKKEFEKIISERYKKISKINVNTVEALERRRLMNEK